MSQPYKKGGRWEAHSRQTESHMQRFWKEILGKFQDLRWGEKSGMRPERWQGLGFPDGSTGKESACHAGHSGDADLISGSGRSPAGGNGNPLQYLCLQNPMDRGAWWAAVQGVAESRTRLKRLSSSCSMQLWESMVVVFSSSFVSDSLWPFELEPTRLFCQWDSLGKNIGVGCHFLLQGIFPIQGSKPWLQHCK